MTRRDLMDLLDDPRNVIGDAVNRISHRKGARDLCEVWTCDRCDTIRALLDAQQVILNQQIRLGR